MLGIETFECRIGMWCCTTIHPTAEVLPICVVYQQKNNEGNVPRFDYGPRIGCRIEGGMQYQGKVWCPRV